MTDLKKVHEGAADLSTTFELFRRHDDKPWDERVESLYDGEWWETDENTYWHFLEMMPPLLQVPGAFVMSEALTGSIYSGFFKDRINGEDRYFHAHFALTSRQAVTDVRNGIVNAVRAELDASRIPGL